LPAAVCASSAKVGPSLSLGQADMVTVVADRGAVADAAATALANLLVTAQDLEGVLAAAAGMAKCGVRGAFIQLGDLVGLVGVPPAHLHILRHACGFALADQGADTRLIQDYLGHRNIQHTVRYTAANSTRFGD